MQPWRSFLTTPQMVMINMIRTVKYISTRHKRKLDTLVEELVERVEKETDEDKEEIIHAVAVLG